MLAPCPSFLPRQLQPGQRQHPDPSHQQRAKSGRPNAFEGPFPNGFPRAEMGIEARTHMNAVRINWINCSEKAMTGWWFQTFFMFHNILGIILPNWLIFFKRGWNQQKAMMFETTAGKPCQVFHKDLSPRCGVRSMVWLGPGTEWLHGVNPGADLQKSQGFSGKKQGLLNVPFWEYWTSPYSSHYRPYT